MSEPLPPAVTALDPEPDFAHPDGQVDWKRAGLTCGLMLLILLGPLAAAVGLFFSRPEAPRRPRVARQAAAEVVTLKPLALTPRVEALGRVRPLRSVALSAQVAGEVVELHPDLDDGNVLPAGTVVARIDARDVEHELAQVRAQIAAQEADLESLKIERETTARRIEAAKQLVQIAEQELARLDDMQGSGVGTLQTVDAARRAVVQSEDGLIALEATQRLLGPREARAKASLAEARAREAQLELRLERTRIVLPFTGMVRDVAVEQHQLVSAPQVVCRILEVDQLELPVSLTLADASLVAPGLVPGQTQARVTREVNGRASEWDARLVRFEPVNPDTQTIVAVLRLDPGPDVAALAPGLFCEVTLSGPPLPPAIVLPRAAIQERERVYRVTEGKLEIVPVVLGAQIGDWVEIREGLRAGEEVVVSTLDEALDGAPVTVTRSVEPRVP